MRAWHAMESTQVTGHVDVNPRHGLDEAEQVIAEVLPEDQALLTGEWRKPRAGPALTAIVGIV